MHLQRGGVDKVARANKLGVLVVLAQDVTDVLAKEALDALAKLLHALDVNLLHAPRSVRRVGGTGPELLDCLLDGKVPGYVGNQVADGGKRVHGFEDHGHVQVEVAEPGHAHELWYSVDFGGTRPA